MQLIQITHNGGESWINMNQISRIDEQKKGSRLVMSDGQAFLMNGSAEEVASKLQSVYNET